MLLPVSQYKDQYEEHDTEHQSRRAEGYTKDHRSDTGKIQQCKPPPVIFSMCILFYPISE